MNTTDINSVLDNICSKIGTTAKMLVPEMAGYMIARYVILIVLAVIFLIASGFCFSRIVKMKRQEKDTVKLYKDMNNQLQMSTSWGGKEPNLVYYTEDDYFYWLGFGIIIGLVGIAILCIGISKIVGWSLSPNAMTVMWIINALSNN